MKYERAIWVGETMIPPQGAPGKAWPAEGVDDPESAEYGAWCFEPDEPVEDQEEVGAYYCDPGRDLQFTTS